MRAVDRDEIWRTRAVTNGETVHEYRARELMREIAESAHACGDPGIQFDTTINHWNPCKRSGRINASNPCSEYMFLDDSACNLASLNLLKFVDEQGQFDVNSFRRAVDVMFTAQEILVDNASYPTPKIGKNSHEYRPIGLGYANLGALLMYMGLPYDSDAGRDYAAAITALMTGQSYLSSAVIAAQTGPFKHFERNRDCFLEVMGQHRSSLNRINRQNVPENLFKAAQAVWDKVVEEGARAGFRNAQATVLAPTGTIGFMMDCDTTGIEPDLALVKYKQMVGGGSMKIINQTVPHALGRLGYSEGKIHDILQHVEETGTIENAPHLAPDHLPIFDCAFKPSGGKRFIHYMGHIKMMAAVQPFLSGAISKTVNMPAEATAEDIEIVYNEAWKLGLKSIAIYRDGSKKIQPLSTSQEKKAAAAEPKPVYQPIRKKLPEERRAITHKFTVGGHEGYITVGMYDDGQPGRDLRGHGQGGQRHLRRHGRLRHRHFHGDAVRRAAQGPGGQVHPHPLRALGLHRQSEHPLRQVHLRLHLQVAGPEVPAGGRARQAGDHHPAPASTSPPSRRPPRKRKPGRRASPSRGKPTRWSPTGRPASSAGR